MKQEEDYRGYDLKADNFKNQLSMIINNSNLNISTVYYIVKDTCNELEKLFEATAAQQYQQFCEEANKELEETKEENKKDETE